MNRKQYIPALYAHFMKPFVNELAGRSSAALSALDQGHCKVEMRQDGISVEFQLAQLFDAVWLHALAFGIELPSHSDWDKDFKAFCRQLMEPWPLASIEAAGFRIKLVHKSSSYARTSYQLSSIN